MALKYDMKFGVTEVARMFDVDRVVVKTWAHRFSEYLKPEFGVIPPQWFENIVLAFVDFDPGSTTFRYGDFPYFLRQGEIWVNLAHIKTLMSWLAKSFQNVRYKRGAISQPVTT